MMDIVSNYTTGAIFKTTSKVFADSRISRQKTPSLVISWVFN